MIPTVTKKQIIDALERVMANIPRDCTKSWDDHSIMCYMIGYYGIMDSEEE
jgi:hypothetical protein